MKKFPAKHTEDIKPITDHIENASTSHMIYYVSRQPDAL